MAELELPEAAHLAALRAWHEGASARQAVARYLPHLKADGQSSRAMLGRIRRQLADFARTRHREDLAGLFEVVPAERAAQARQVSNAIEQLRCAPRPQPIVTDPVERWLASRAARCLRAEGIKSLADLTVRVPRRRRWWVAIPGLGQATARSVEAFFAAHPELTERARQLIASDASRQLVPWELLVLPDELDGSRGQFRAPSQTSVLRASNDHQAIQAWLDLHDAVSTRRAYQKEAERLVLWAIVERGCAMSSLSTEDAVAYRKFLRHPSPRWRWVGPSTARTSPEWRPFAGDLAPRSVAYALSVVGAMFRWLIEQRYLVANPFAGVKVRGQSGKPAVDAARAFTQGEWSLVRAVAEGLEWSYGWSEEAARRMRFVLDFCYPTGLRANELVSSRLGDIARDSSGEAWLKLVGKGEKSGTVYIPPTAYGALEGNLSHRGVSTIPSRWDLTVYLLGSLREDSGRITAGRLWAITRRFFHTAAEVVEKDAPVLAAKLRRASPHWMRHTHATHALQNGAELPTVRDNLRHASVSTTSVYLHSDQDRRARQLKGAFK